jgi:hypothetical protein
MAHQVLSAQGKEVVASDCNIGLIGSRNLSREGVREGYFIHA